MDLPKDWGRLFLFLLHTPKCGRPHPYPHFWCGKPHPHPHYFLFFTAPARDPAPLLFFWPHPHPDPHQKQHQKNKTAPQQSLLFYKVMLLTDVKNSKPLFHTLNRSVMKLCN